MNAEIVYLNGEKSLPVRNARGRKKVYDRRIATRERQFNKKASKGLIQYTYQETMVDRKRYAYEKARAKMSEQELAMDYDQWMTYLEQIGKNEALTYKRSGEITQSLAVAGMGIYNCDQLRRLEDPQEIFVRYQRSDSTELFPARTFVINKKKNQVFTYSGEQLIYSKSPNSENLFVSVNQDNTVAWCGQQSINTAGDSSDGRKVVTMKPVSCPDGDLSALKKVLGF